MTLVLVGMLLVTAFAAVSAPLSVRGVRPGDLIYPAGLAAPAIIASLIAACAGSPAELWERATSRRLGIARAAVLAIEILLGVTATTLSCIGLSGNFGILAGERNLLGFLGIAALGASLLGPRLAWLGTLLWIGLPPFFYPNRADDTLGVATFYAQPTTTTSSILWAALLFVVGMTAVIVRMPKERVRG